MSLDSDVKLEELDTQGTHTQGDHAFHIENSPACHLGFEPNTFIL